MKLITLLILSLLAWLIVPLFSTNSLHFSQNRVTFKQVTPSSYYSDEQEPIVVGQIEQPNNQYIHVKFKFLAKSLTDYPNLFQTDPINTGIRIEAHNNALSIVFSESSGVSGLPLTNKLITDHWYDFEMEAENKSFIKVWLDGRLVSNYKSLQISMGLSNVMFGEGFNSNRIFKGYIKEIELTTGNKEKTFLGSVSSIIGFNALMLLMSIALTFISIMTYRFILSFRYQALFSKTKIITSLIIPFQLLLFYYLPPYCCVFVVISFLLFLGSSLYYLLTPKFLRASYNWLILSPIYGIALITIVGTGLIANSLDIHVLTPLLTIIAISLHILNYRQQHSQIASTLNCLKSDVLRYILIFTGIFTPIILILLYPVLSIDSLSTYRVGPDLASYAKMTQYLLDGGSLHHESVRAYEFVNMTPGEINRYTNATMSWPLMYFFRWGLIAYESLVTIITNTQHTYETIFISMLVPYLLISGLVIIWLHRLLKLSSAFSLLGGVIFLFNSNLINLWYEGFYGNLYVMPFIILILITYQYLRTLATSLDTGIIKPTLMLTILISACLLSYPEAIIFLSGVFLIIIFTVDALLKRPINFLSYLILFSTLLLALLMISPYGFFTDWLSLAFKQITQEGGNGYSQPFWAFPNEIIGLVDIYIDSTPGLAGQILQRSNVNTGVTFILTMIILIIIVKTTRQRWEEDNVLFIASISMLVIFACYVYLKSPSHNYAYMKIYIYLLPLLFINFWGSLIYLSQESLAKSLRWVNYSCQYLVTWIAALIILNGIFYILRYENEAKSISPSEIQLYSQLRNINLDKVIIYPAYLEKMRYIYAALLPAHWMISEEWDANHWAEKPFYLNYLDHKVYILIEKDGSYICYLKNKTIIFENNDFLIIDSGLKVRESLKNNGSIVDFNMFDNLISCSRN